MTTLEQVRQAAYEALRPPPRVAVAMCGAAHPFAAEPGNAQPDVVKIGRLGVAMLRHQPFLVIAPAPKRAWQWPESGAADGGERGHAR
jgi:hypothetical protein